MRLRRIFCLSLLTICLVLTASLTDVLASAASGGSAGAEVGSNATYQKDQNFVDVDNSVDIWDNGQGISISAGGDVFIIPEFGNYLVAISRFLDLDGVYTTQVDIWQSIDIRALKANVTCETDGSVKIPISVLCPGGSFKKQQGYYYRFLVRDGNFKHEDGTWGDPAYNSYLSLYDNGSVIADGFYSSPYFSGKYLFYSSFEQEFADYYITSLNLLPNTPTHGGDTSIPYKTTFRMLTDNAVTYNTFFYTSSYKSGADAVSAAGTIYCLATTLADGKAVRTKLNAPQLLCQISSYGTVYDIVDTNDDNLCQLLGISRPSKKYWDVAAQEWKTSPGSSSGNSSGSGSSGDSSGTGSDGSSDIDTSLIVSDSKNLSSIKDLALKLVGDDALIDPVVFNDYYAGQVFHANKLEDLNTPVWGLGNYLTWSYDGIKSETVDSSGSLLTQTKNLRRIKLVVKCTFKIDHNTQKTLTYTLFDYDNAKGIAVGTGSRKISFYDLCMYYQAVYPEYITDFPTQLQQITYYLTPFYYDKDEGKYHIGSTSRVTQNVNSALADYSGGNWDGSDDGWSNVTDDSDFVWDLKNFKNMIVDGVASVGKFFSNALNSTMDIFSKLGQVPGMISDVFSFLPAEFVAAVGVGLSLWLLPSLLGLARAGLKALGGLGSSLVDVVSNFFGKG